MVVLIFTYHIIYHDDHGKETFVKNSCIDNDLDGNCEAETDDELTNNEIIWSDNDEIDIVLGGAKKQVQLSMNSNIN